MAEVDNLDALSNAELREQMKAQGLPNIPVTDSSRKVLVKRLRASLGGNATLPASPKKAGSNRRETLQPAPASVVSVDKRDGATSSKDVGTAATPSKARRTIAATPNDTKEAAERRRKPEAVAPPLTRVPEATTAKPVATTTVPAPKAAAPIQSRRISNAAKPETLAEKTTTAGSKQRSPENLLEVNSLIILESDEEEDEQLAQAAQNAEDQYKYTQKAATAKLTTTATSTHQYASKPVYRAPEPVQEPLQRRTQLYDGPSVSQARNTLGGYDYSSFNRTGRYSSYVGSTAPASAAVYPSTTSSIHRRSPPRTYNNEFSDDTAEEEDPTQAQGGVKFESDFARKLAMLRSERIGDRSSSYNRHSAGRTASTYEPVARRSLRPDNVTVSVAFSRWIQSLDRTYNLKSKLFILFVLVIIYFVYKFYY